MNIGEIPIADRKKETKKKEKKKENGSSGCFVAATRLCDGCREAAPVTICCDCFSRYCSSCRPSDPQGEASDRCSRCLTSAHMRSAFSSLSLASQATEQDLELMRKRLDDVVDAIESAEATVQESASKAGEMIRLISERADKARANFALVVRSHESKLHEAVDEEFKRYETEAALVILRLRDHRKDLKSRIESAERQLFCKSNSTDAIDLLPIGFDGVNVDSIRLQAFNVRLLYDDGVEIMDLDHAVGRISEGLEIVPTREHEFSKEIESFAIDENCIFLSYKCNCKVDVFAYDGMTFKSSHVLNTGLARIVDLLALDGKLFAFVGSVDSDKIINVNVGISGDPETIFLQPVDFFFGTRRLSRSVCGNILVVIGNKMSLMTPNGNVIETIVMPFIVQDAVQLDRFRFAARLTKEICILDWKGSVLKRCAMQVEFLRPVRLAKDKLNNIIDVDYHDQRLVVFTGDLNLLASYDIEPTSNILKVCYDEHRDEVVLLQSKKIPHFNGFGLQIEGRRYGRRFLQADDAQIEMNDLNDVLVA